MVSRPPRRRPDVRQPPKPSGSTRVTGRRSGIHADVERLVDQRNSAGATEPIYGWGTLEYEGRAWLGERLRLGPPSAQYERAVRTVLI
jgi:hypothetical protein